MSKKLINVVLDLETLGTSEDAAIIQIGCCIPRFDHGHILGLPYEFEATIAYEACLDNPWEFDVDNATMEWWEKQPTKTQVFSGQDTYEDAFDKFCSWITEIKEATEGDIKLYGNGSDFDNRLLSYSLNALGYEIPWNFRNNMCLRTFRTLFPIATSEPRVHETKHTALGDARFEARILTETYDQYPELRGRI